MLRSIVALSLTALIAAVPAAAAGPPAAGGPRPISSHPGFAVPCSELPFGALEPEGEFQPQIAVDPVAPSHLAVAWTQGVFLGTVLGISADAGRTWRQTTAPVSRCEGGKGGFAADQVVAFAPDGELYMAAVTGGEVLTALVAGDQSSRISLLRSDDDGRTWSDPVAIVDDGRHNDRPALAVDPRDPARLCAVWTPTRDDGGFEMASACSRDAGRTWTPPRTAYAPPAGRWPNEPSLQILEDGSILTVFEDADPATDTAREMALHSTNGGASWSPTVIASTHATWPGDPDADVTASAAGARDEVIGNAEPALASDPTGRLWVAWQDIAAPRSSAIRIACSTDDGASWSAPALVAAVDGQAWLPTMAADASGRLALTWYDTRRDRPGDAAWTADVWSAISADQGSIWRQRRVAGPFDLRTALAEGPGTYALGNAMGLAAVPGGFGAAFAMSEPQAAEPPQDIFFARIQTHSQPRRKARTASTRR